MPSCFARRLNGVSTELTEPDLGLGPLSDTVRALEQSEYDSVVGRSAVRRVADRVGLPAACDEKAGPDI